MKENKCDSQLDDAAGDEISKMLGLQKYPSELDKYLNLINAEAQVLGWPIVVIKAYCFGVINGKRGERRKKKI